MTNVSAVNNTNNNAPENFNKIQRSWGDCLFTILMAISVVGLFYQSWKLQEALQCGQTKEAEERLRKGGWFWYKHTINSNDIRELAKDGRFASIKLIKDQILFNKKDPTGGSNAATALIEARDLRDTLQKIDKADEICTILLNKFPYTEFPETKYYSSRPFSNSAYPYFVDDKSRWN